MDLSRIVQGPSNGAAVSGFAGSASADDSSWQNVAIRLFEAVTRNSEGTESLLLLRAMIAAAASDGHLNSAERSRILEEAERLQLSRQDKTRFFDELQNPPGMQQIVAEASNPGTAVEVYAASLIAIGEYRPGDLAYLRSLAMALELPAELVELVHQQVAEARHEAVAA